MNIIEKIEAAIAERQIVKARLLAVESANREETRTLERYAQKNNTGNLLIIEGRQTFFLVDKNEFGYLCGFFFKQSYPSCITPSLCKIEMEVSLTDEIKKRLEDGEVVPVNPYSFLLKKIEQMHHQLANLTQGILIDEVPEVKRVQYKLCTIVTVLQKHIEDACSDPCQDMTALRPVKQELEELVVSKDYKRCQDLHETRTCFFLTESVQCFVKQMRNLFTEICA